MQLRVENGIVIARDKTVDGKTIELGFLENQARTPMEYKSLLIALMDSVQGCHDHPETMDAYSALDPPEAT